jgi:23S rRNA 5-hydroxycytidine C2501 synthase
MNRIQSLELLAPAGSADIGVAAINHGADAVYVGAPRFSARANAGVSSTEIARLIRHAHLYYAKVYVALNTILTDEEIPEAVDVIHEVYDLGADGLIIQDPGLLEARLPPIPLIASTQMHNDTPEKIRFLEDVGFKRVILARELSLEEITAIRQVTNIELELFVHGALCVCYSGQCYMSQAVTGRSGNRGVCAQPCRSRYTLSDGDGNIVIADKYLLSLKDLNLASRIPDLISAGITSFKIEGRYKGIDYVKNVTAAYGRELNAFIRSRPEYRRSSSGRTEPGFLPDPAKTFNRGFTGYFISGGMEKMSSMDTPKSIGEPVGAVTRLGKGFFQTAGSDLHNGDGICFFTQERKLAGFRIERVEGHRIYPSTMKDLAEGILLYRNFNLSLVRTLQKASCRRSISVEMDFSHDGDAVLLTAGDEDGNKVELAFSISYEAPKDPRIAREQVEKHLQSTGNTPFKVAKVNLPRQVGFYQARFLNSIRRRILESLEMLRAEKYPRETRVFDPNCVPYPESRLRFQSNVLNENARRFYQRHGAEILEPAFEILPNIRGKEVMHMRYCLRRELGACLKSDRSRRRLKEPLQLSDSHHAYRLKFDCEACRVSLIFLGRK